LKKNDIFVNYYLKLPACRQAGFLLSFQILAKKLGIFPSTCLPAGRSGLGL
jgi:hypothetical protein